MQVIYTILYILLFVFCLSVLVVIHELGHFAVAKFFKVYCQEFSIGFGPAIVHKKRKNGETYFSLRAIPFGGYVSMYGEGGTIPEGVESIDPSRSFTNIKKWKRILILVAGVFNNAVLALILFIISNSCFIQQAMYLNNVGVVSGSIAEIAGIKDEDYISLRMYEYKDEKGDVVQETGYYTVDSAAKVIYNDETSKDVYAILTIANATFSERSYDTNLKFFEKNASGYANLGKEIDASETNLSKVSYNISIGKGAYKQYINSSWTYVPSEKPTNPVVNEAWRDLEEHKLKKWNGSSWVNSSYDSSSYIIPESPNEFYVWYDLEDVVTPHNIELKVETNKENKYAFEESGLSFYYEEYWNNAGQVFTNSFRDWGNSATAIVRALGGLFTSAESWKDVGGVIAIGVQTTNILQNFGLGRFIYVWGLISVNLAIFNLLPFPGLDGWQIVVLAVEAIFHKEIPEKIKNIVSFIGIAILFAFMILVLIKDVIGLF